MSWDDGKLEMIHDFIQWLFPTDEPSRFNPDAPILDEEDLTTFREPFFQQRLEQAAERFRKFYRFGAISPRWAQPFDHNLLRITRIVRCLALLGPPGLAVKFREDAKTTARSSNVPLEGSIAFWDRAIPPGKG